MNALSKRKFIYWLIMLALLLMVSLAPTIKAQDNTPLSLADALSSQQLAITEIVGSGLDGGEFLYDQPMIVMTLTNQSDTPLDLVLPIGTELYPEGNSPPVVTLGFIQSQLRIEAGMTIDAGVVAFLTRVQTSPSVKNSYQFLSDAGTDNQQLLSLLHTIQQRGEYIGTDLTPQFAVWQVAGSAVCEDIDAELQQQFGMSVGCGSKLASNAQQLIRQASGSESNLTEVVTPTPSPDSSPVAELLGMPVFSILLLIFIPLYIVAYLLYRKMTTSSMPLSVLKSPGQGGVPRRASPSTDTTDTTGACDKRGGNPSSLEVLHINKEGEVLHITKRDEVSKRVFSSGNITTASLERECDPSPVDKAVQMNPESNQDVEATKQALASLPPTIDAYATARIHDLPDDKRLRVGVIYHLEAGVLSQLPTDPAVQATPVQLPDQAEITVDIVVYAPGMAIEPHWIQSFTLYQGKESSLAKFLLTPRESGRQDIRVEFFYQNNWLAQIKFEVEVLNVSEATLPAS